MGSRGSIWVGGLPGSCRTDFFWALGKRLNLSYHNKETILLTVDPYDGNLNLGAEYLSPKKVNLLNYNRFIQAPKG